MIQLIILAKNDNGLLLETVNCMWLDDRTDRSAEYVYTNLNIMNKLSCFHKFTI